jgi:hypothetical protein
VNRVVGHYLDYVEIAQRALTVEIGGLGAAIKRLRGPGAKPARLTDDFYRLIASDYRQRSESGVSAPLQSLADAHHADKSTASRWIKEARRRGYLDVPPTEVVNG